LEGVDWICFAHERNEWKVPPHRVIIKYHMWGGPPTNHPLVSLKAENCLINGPQLDSEEQVLQGVCLFCGF